MGNRANAIVVGWSDGWNESAVTVHPNGDAVERGRFAPPIPAWRGSLEDFAEDCEAMRLEFAAEHAVHGPGAHSAACDWGWRWA